jgi:hypothetical protein
MPESYIENITLENIDLYVDRPDAYDERAKNIGGWRSTADERDTLYARQPAYGAFAYVKGLKIEDFNVHLNGKKAKGLTRSALYADHINGGFLEDVTIWREQVQSDSTVIDMKNHQGVRIGAR